MTTETKAKEEPKTKKSRQRSPNYPAVGLKAAVEKARLLYEADKRTGAPVDAALKHMGFSTQHGQALAVLSALKKFGLVEDASGRIVPTQRAIDILVFQDQDERRVRGLQEAALSPGIYRELFEQYRPTGMPSDETLRAELIADKHFNPNAVEGFIQDFKDTLVFAGMMDSLELSLQVGDKLEMTDSAQMSAQPNASAGKSLASSPPSHGDKTTIVNTWTLSPQARAELRISGDVSTEDLELLRDYVEITIKALSRNR